jgi:LysR family transcriptional activator of mexEF-oprN operon
MDSTRDPRQLDLDLLRLFVALMEERHVTRAGARLFLSQPAASGRLARLREFFDDPLVVRNGNDLAPTARAEGLYASIMPALQALESTLAAETPFDPAADQRIFRIGTSDACAIAVLPALLERLREEAPNCHIVVREGDHLTMPGMLANGEVSTVLGYLASGLPSNARQRSLGRAAWVVVRDAQTPSIEILDAFCARPHAMVTPAGDLHGFVDDALEKVGRKRNVMVGVTASALLIPALRGTDLVATVPDYLARRMARFGGLAVDQPPVELQPSQVSLAWTAAADRDPSERWFRGIVASCFQKEMQAT